MLVVAALLGAAASLGARPLLADEGPPIAVLVADRDLPRGHELTDDDLTVQRWPADLAPDGLVDHPTGTLVTTLPAGSPLTERHTTATGIVGLVPDGLVAVPLPVDDVPATPVGSTVTVVAIDHDGRGVSLASGAEVVATDESSVWVAVPAEQGPDVAGAALGHRVTLVLHPP